MNTEIGVDTKKATLQGVVFPLHTDAQAALEQYRNKRVNYVQLVSFGRLIFFFNCVFIYLFHLFIFINVFNY